MPLVYTVWFRGKLVIEPPAGADAAGDAELLLDDEPLVHALTVASVSTATAAVPYLATRHRPLVMPLIGLTCSYLLTSKSSGNPGFGVVIGRGRMLRADTARQPLTIRPLSGYLSVLGSALPLRVRYLAVPVPPLNRWAIPVKC